MVSSGRVLGLGSQKVGASSFGNGVEVQRRRLHLGSGGGVERIMLDALGGEAESGSPGSLHDSRKQESKYVLKNLRVALAEKVRLEIQINSTQWSPWILLENCDLTSEVGLH